MPLNEFWYGDMRLLQVYQKGYLKDVSFQAWYNGKCNFDAHSLALKGAFKGLKNESYPDWEDLSEKLYKPQKKVKDIEEEFRKQQCMQTAWISSILQQK